MKSVMLRLPIEGWRLVRPVVAATGEDIGAAVVRLMRQGLAAVAQTSANLRGGEVVALSLDDKARAAVASLAQKTGRLPFDIVQAAFAKALRQITEDNSLLDAERAKKRRLRPYKSQAEIRAEIDAPLAAEDRRWAEADAASAVGQKEPAR